MKDITVKELAKNIKNGFLNLLFPENITCNICGKELEKGINICPECLNKLSIIKNPCSKCGCEVSAGNYCVRCKYSLPDFEKCFPACSYGNFEKNIIYRLKNGDRYLSKTIASLMAKRIENSGVSFDVITCVPVTKKVKAVRGYNQSELLAEDISYMLKIPFEAGLLQKTTETAYQKDLSARERRKNVEGAFYADKKLAQGKTILLTDDVMTTGSTLSACSKELAEKGAKAVYCAVFAAVSASVSFDAAANAAP